MLLKHINMRSEEAYLPQMNFILPRIMQLIDQKRYHLSSAGNE